MGCPDAYDYPSGYSPGTVRTALLVAYHFPPIAGSSGLQRTLRFAQYLPEFGWRPVVPSVRPSAYERLKAC